MSVLPELLAIAATIWGQPACGQPIVHVTPLPRETVGEAHFDTCSFDINSYWWRKDSYLLCIAVVHEWGHLRLGPTAFAATNPGDPAHSPNPWSVMSEYGSWNPRCDKWVAGRELQKRAERAKMHRMARKKNKPQTAASGGSKVLLAARLQTGAGKHADKRRQPRGTERRRAIHESLGS